MSKWYLQIFFGSDKSEQLLSIIKGFCKSDLYSGSLQ